MYRVLLVEDEYLERESRRQSPIWSLGEFELVADAANGEDAWEILQREPVDILVTDIKMPFMDGLELSNLVVRHLPQVRIIILSGHTEFKLAQQALRIGVGDYIVKPIRTDDLLQALRKAAADLDHERQLMQEIEDYRKQTQVQAKLNRQTFYENLTDGLIPKESIKTKAADLGLDLGFRQSSCAILVYFNEKAPISDADYLLLLECHQIVEDLAEKAQITVFSRHLRESDFIFPDLDLPATKQILNRIFSEIKVLYKQNQKTWQPVISLGGLRQGLTGIAESFADAQYLLNYQLLYEQTGPLFFDEALPALRTTYAKELAISDVQLAIDNILRAGGRQEAAKLVDSLVRRLFALNLSPMHFQFICIEIDNTITRFLLELDEEPARIDSQRQDSSDNMLAGTCFRWINDIGSFTEHLTQLLTQVIEIRDTKNKTRFVKMVAVAKKYIEENYADFDISLSKVAAHINVNPSYFSSLFSQVMGESFIEYLTRVRIEKAKKLIKTTNHRTTDIAYMVGYNDSNYFSKIFKKITQITPRSFKNSL